MSKEAPRYPRWKHHATKKSLIVHNEAEEKRHVADGYAEHRGGLHSPKLTHEPDPETKQEQAPESDLGGTSSPEFDGKSEDELKEILMGIHGIPAKKLKGKTYAELVEMIKGL